MSIQPFQRTYLLSTRKVKKKSSQISQAKSYLEFWTINWLCRNFLHTPFPVKHFGDAFLYYRCAMQQNVLGVYLPLTMLPTFLRQTSLHGKKMKCSHSLLGHWKWRICAGTTFTSPSHSEAGIPLSISTSLSVKQSQHWIPHVVR